MRTILSMCVMVLFLPWKLNGTLNGTLSPSASSKHEGTSEDLGLATRGQGSTVTSKDSVSSPKWPSYITAVSPAEHKILEGQITKVENTSEDTSENHGPHTRGFTVLYTRNQDQRTSEFRSEKDTSSSKWPLYTVVSQAKHINTEVRITTENESPSHSSFQVAWKGQTKRSLDFSSQSGGTSEGHGPSTGIQVSTVTSTRNREVITTELKQDDGVISSKINSQVTQDQPTTGMGHTEPKTTEVQITTGESESPSQFSSITSSKEQTKRSPAYSQNHQTTSTPTKQNTLGQKDRNTTGDEQTTINILKSTDKVSVTDNQQQEFSRSTKSFFNHTNHTNFQTEVATDEPGNTSEFPQTNVQTTKPSSQPQEKEGTKPTTDLQSLNTTDSNTKSANDNVSALSNSTTEGIVTANSSMTTSGSSTGLVSTENMETVTTATTGMKTEITVTSGMSTSTTTPTNISTTQRQNSKPEVSNDPNKRKEGKKKENAGPIVAALIGSALLLMFIAIFVILIRRRQTHKKKLENSDWAGPSPFLEGDAQPDKCGHGEDGLFHRRDTKRISLHSFLPQRLSQRLSLLVEEEVQMNDMAASSTFGRNEQPQNGKQSVEQVQAEKQKDGQGPASEASADSTVPETVIGPAVLGDNANTEPMSKPDDETIPPPSPKTNTAVPPPSSFEDVDLNPLQTNIVNAPPAPPLP